MNRKEQERALVGAALLDEAIARLLFCEVRDHELADPTARLAWWALRRAYEPVRAIEEELENAAREEEVQLFWAKVDAVDEPSTDVAPVYMTDLEVVAEALDCAGLLTEAGGADAVAALVADRPALRDALAAGRAAVAAIAPLPEEPLVAYAATLLSDPEAA